MRICIYSKTPLAAAPWELYKALKKYTLHDVNLINEKDKYHDDQIFPFHLLWASNNGTAQKALENADIWHINNYLPGHLSRFRAAQRVMAQFHSMPRPKNWNKLVRFADVSYTIAQPLQEKEYPIPALPSIIDPDEYLPQLRQKKIKIAFLPTAREAIDHPIKEILNTVAIKRNVDIEWIEENSYERNLAIKRESHILIDDIVTGNWHRTTLEGACFGCAVLNRVRKVPFLFTSLQTLQERLIWLIDNPYVLKDFQERMRLWALQEWHAMDTIKKYTDAYKKLAEGRME